MIVAPNLHIQSEQCRAIPRFTGCPSARVTTLGGRYDYHFDVHDRLTRADYTPKNADSREDFSAEYSYGVMANPLKVKRWGVIDRSDDGERTFGLMDELSYEYDEARRPVRISSSGEGNDFYGRTGFPLSDAEIMWTALGQLYSDSARGIESSTYNHRGQLLTQRIVGNGSVMLSSRYDADGRLIRRGYSRITPQGSYTSDVRVYSANQVFYKGKLEYSYFPGGYFDAEGKIHYTFTDYQGSVIMVTDSVGKVEQHTGYYPYGTPWSLPSGQRRLHIGKELVDETANYVYEPRNYYSAALLWDSNDAHADSYPSLSPYTFCAANPIRNIDPTGMDVWMMNIRGKVQDCIETDLLDFIMIQNDDSSIAGQSKVYKYGTITQVGSDGQPLNENNDDGYTRFRVNDNNAATEVFEMMSKR